ncbi:MAG: nucleotidyltransferase domain-containing protein [Gammaproteobacteria bacterium]
MFGSFVRGEAHDDSDADVFVEFDAQVRVDHRGGGPVQRACRGDGEMGGRSVKT